MTTKTKALRVVDHPELGQLELLSEVICRAAVLPAESRHPRDYQVLERPVLHKLQGLALPRPDGRMALTRALLRDRWRIEVCEQHWRWLNPEAKGRKDRWHEARCAHYVHARTEKRPQVPHFQAQTLWARPDVDLIWSGEPAQPQPPVSPCFYRIVRGDDLWSLLSDIRFKPGTETQARQLVNQLADNFNRQEFASLLLRIRPAGTHSGFALHNGIRTKLSRHHPKPGEVFIATPTLQRWFRDWAYAWNLGIELPQLSQFIERLNESLPPEQWIRSPQDLRQLLESKGIAAGWKLLSRFGASVLRPFDQASNRRPQNARELLAAILVQTRMGNAELFPPWFLRQYIRLREETGAPPLGQPGWRHLPPELFSEAGRRASRAKAAATRLKLIREVSLLLACPAAALLSEAYKSGGWQAALKVALDESQPLANALEIRGLRFVPLVAEKDFMREGTAMSHCLDEWDFDNQQRNLNIRYVSIRLPTGSRLATATIQFSAEKGWTVVEAWSERNSKPDEHVVGALKTYASQLASPEPRPLPPPSTGVNLVELNRVLPRSGACPTDLAIIRGLGGEQDYVYLVEPPAGGLPDPYVDPWQLLRSLARFAEVHGQFSTAARETEQWIATLPPTRRVLTLGEASQDKALRVPALAFVFELDRQGWVSPSVIDYLHQVLATVSEIKIAPVEGPAMSLTDWVRTPYSRGLSVYQPSPVWLDDEHWTDAAWQLWRERIKPIALLLQRVLGQEVAHFADPADEFDDDVFHRNLLIHACCELAPAAAYVRFLAEVSAASDVESLKRAMIDPASYGEPFILSGFGSDVWVEILHFRYPDSIPSKLF